MCNKSALWVAGIAMLLPACVTPLPDNSLPYEGNVKPEDYVHVSGAPSRRNANVETAQLVAGAAVGAAVGVGVANATNSNVVTAIVPLPSGAGTPNGPPAADATADCFTTWK